MTHDIERLKLISENKTGNMILLEIYAIATNFRVLFDCIVGFLAIFFIKGLFKSLLFISERI